jgi:hypothetical protein
MPGCVSARIAKNAGASLGIDVGKKFTGYPSIAQKKSCPARCNMRPASGLRLGKGLDLVIS